MNRVCITSSLSTRVCGSMSNNSHQLHQQLFLSQEGGYTEGQKLLLYSATRMRMRLTACFLAQEENTGKEKFLFQHCWNYYNEWESMMEESITSLHGINLAKVAANFQHLTWEESESFLKFPVSYTNFNLVYSWTELPSMRSERLAKMVRCNHAPPHPHKHRVARFMGLFLKILLITSQSMTEVNS